MSFGKFYSYLLVFFQFFIVFLLIIHSHIKNINIFIFVIIASGVILGLKAIITMKKGKLRFTPDVAKNARMITSGPYRFIRHPMYTSVLTICLGLFLTNAYPTSFFLYLFLIFVLFLKINYEEKLLANAFSDYKIYADQTKRLIPFIY